MIGTRRFRDPLPFGELPPGRTTVMYGSETTQLQALLVRLRQGDPAARRELINHAYPKLRRLAAKLLSESFPRLRQQPTLLETSDLVNDAAVRLYQALEDVEPPTVLDFLRLAAWKMRNILLDLAKKPALPLEMQTPPEDRELPWPARTPDTDTIPKPSALGKLHEQVERLPEEERAVVDLLFYHELKETEAAELLGVSAKTVRRRWLSAKLRLGQALQAAVPGVEEGFRNV